VAAAADADAALAAAAALLRQTPFGVVASPVCDAITERVLALCARVCRAHAGHRAARLLEGRALMLLARDREAEAVLRELGDEDGEAVAARLECLLRLGRLQTFGELRERMLAGGR
jgi:hypothetical protein